MRKRAAIFDILFFLSWVFIFIPLIRCSLRSRLVVVTAFRHFFDGQINGEAKKWRVGSRWRVATQTKSPRGINPRCLRKWRLPPLPQRSAVPSAMLSLCPVHSLLPAPLSAPLSTAPERRRRAQPTPRMAHTAPHSATPPPMRHTYQPQNLPIPPDSIKDMVSLNRECFLRAHVCII